MSDFNIYEDACNPSPISFYWRDIEKIVVDYNEKILLENNLINQSYLKLKASNFALIVGISIVRDFKPSVKLIDCASNKYVTFISSDWRDFIHNLVNRNETNLGTSYDGGNFKILYRKDFYNNIKIVVDTIEDSIYLSEGCIEEMKTVQPLINYRLQIIQDLNFGKFYENALQYVNKLPSTCSGDVIEHLKNMCHLNNNILSYCLLECIDFDVDKVMYDIDQLLLTKI